MESIGQFLDQYGLPAIFTLLLVKGLGVPIPVPGDFLMLLAGVRAASGTYDLLAVIVALMGATLLAGAIQYTLARGPSRPIVYRFGRYIGLTPPRLDRAAATIQRRGATAVAVGTLTPGLSLITPIAAGLARLAAARFATGLFTGSALFVGAHIALGYILGPSVLTALENLHLPILPIVAGLALLGLAVWLARTALRRRAAPGGSPTAPAASPPPSDTLRTLAAWTEAGCPICMLAGRLDLGEPSL